MRGAVHSPASRSCNMPSAVASVAGAEKNKKVLSNPAHWGPCAFHAFLALSDGATSTKASSSRHWATSGGLIAGARTLLLGRGAALRASSPCVKDGCTTPCQKAPHRRHPTPFDNIIFAFFMRPGMWHREPAGFRRVPKWGGAILGFRSEWRMLVSRGRLRGSGLQKVVCPLLIGGGLRAPGTVLFRGASTTPSRL